MELLDIKQMALDAALMVAADAGALEDVKKLLAAGANAQASPLRGASALMKAVSRRRPALVELLLPLSDLAIRSPNGLSLLAVAALSGCEKTIELLAPHFDPDERFDGKTALMLAAKEGLSEAARALMERSDPNARDAQGRSALHIAAEQGQEAVIAVLLERCDPNALDAGGETPLMRALGEGWPEAAKALAAASDLKARSADGYTALDIAKYSQTLSSAEKQSLHAHIANLMARQAAMEERGALEGVCDHPRALPKTPRV